MGIIGRLDQKLRLPVHLKGEHEVPDLRHIRSDRTGRRDLFSSGIDGAGGKHLREQHGVNAVAAHGQAVCAGAVGRAVAVERGEAEILPDAHALRIPPGLAGAEELIGIELPPLHEPGDFPGARAVLRRENGRAVLRQRGGCGILVVKMIQQAEERRCHRTGCKQSEKCPQIGRSSHTTPHESERSSEWQLRQSCDTALSL